MKRTDTISRKARYGILAALMAGAFSIMPVAQALPTGGTSTTASISTSDTTMNITSAVESNLIKWTDFSLNAGDIVNFVGVNYTYLNVVTGANQSIINGAINGTGANVYLINPHGILFGDGASVNVGSLHLSTADISSSLTDFATAKAALGSAVNYTGDIINRGTLQAANEITVDGENISFKNPANVTANGTPGAAVDLKTHGGDIYIGHTGDTTQPAYTMSETANMCKLITSLSEFNAIKNGLSGSYMLANDIDAGNTNPRIVGSTGFTGKFDGLGYAVKNINIISSDAADMALFNTNSGIIRNVTVTGNVGGNTYAAGITGQNSGVIEYVVNEATVNCYGPYSGGIAGRNTGIIRHVVNKGNVIGLDGNLTNNGGIVGISSGQIDDAENRGNLTGNGYLGGIVGGNSSGGQVTNSRNFGNITSVYYKAGGIVGRNAGTVSGVSNAGNVSASYSVGGIVGHQDDAGTTSNAFNSGDVTGTSINVGGIVGNNDTSDGVIESSRNTGNLTAVSGVGGIVGANKGTVKNITQNDSFTLTGNLHIGTIVGHNAATGKLQDITNNAAFTITSGTNVGGIVGINDGTSFTNVTNTGNITATGSSHVGGIIGYNRNGTLDGTSTTIANSGTIKGYAEVGGVVGYTDKNVKNVTNTGAVNGEQRIGGVVGVNNGGTISYVSNSSAVEANLGDSQSRNVVGGVVGRQENSGTISNAVNSGSVSGSNVVGGIVGNNVSGVVDSSGNTSTASIYAGAGQGGGIAGVNAGTIQNITVTESFAIYSRDHGSPVVGYNNGVLTNVHNTADFTISGNINAGGIVGLNEGTSFTNVTNSGKINAPNVERVGGIIGYNRSYNTCGILDGSSTIISNTGEIVGKKSVGGIVGENSGIVRNITQANNLTLTSTQGNVGGVVGNNVVVSGKPGGLLQNLSNTGNITVTAGNNVGGVVGSNAYILSDTAASLSNSGTITATGSDNVGGVIGSNSAVLNGSIVSITNTGTVNGKNYVGGLVGLNSGTLQNFDLTTAQTLTGTSYLGGLVGGNSGTVTKVRNFAAVTGTGAYTGGLVGQNSGTFSIAYNDGNVTGGNTVGGLAGETASGGSLLNAYNKGTVSGSANVGGVAGQNSGTVQYTYTLGDKIIGNGTAALDSFYQADEETGTQGRTLTQLKSAATYTGWDLDAEYTTTKTWRIYDGYTTPMLTAFLTNLDLSTLVTESDKTMTYNGALNQAVYKADILAADPGLNGDYLKEAAYRNVGTYQTIYSDDNRGYNINHGKLTINKAVLTVTANALNKTYDGTTEGTGGTYSKTGLMGTDTFTGAALAFTDKTAGGGKTLNVSGGTINDGNGGNNYTLTYVANTGSTISPKALTVSFSDADKTYDGSNNAALGTETLSGIVTGDTVSLDHTGMSASYASKNAGTQTVTYTGLALMGTDAGNYTINGTATGTGTINKAALTVTANALNKTYDGTTEGTGGTYSTTGLMGTDTFTGAALAFTDKNAGSGKTLNVSGGTINDGNGGNNYTLTYVANTGSTISPKAITVSFSDADKTYDGTQEAAIGAETFSGVVAGDAVSLDRSGMGATYAAKNAGTQSVNYTGIALTGTDAGNYTINSTAVGSGTIQPKALTFTPSSAVTKTYDGTTAIMGTGTTTGIVAGDVVSTSAVGNFADKNAGSGKDIAYAITLTGADAGNYTINSTAAGTGTINKAALTVTANALNKTYDGTTEGTGGTYSTTGLMGTDTFTGAALAFTDKNAGSGKTLNVSGGIINDGNGGNNYTITYVSNSGSTIAPKAITVSFSDADKTYDGTQAAAIGAETFSGVVAGDAVSLDRSGMGATYAAKKAGTQSVNYTGIALTGTDAGNYTINSTAVGAGTIQPKALTFTPSSAVTKTYDGTTQVTGTGTTAGLVNGDDVTTIAMGTFVDRNVGTDKGVSYNITLTGTDAGNYTINSTAAGTGTINKAALTVKANALNKTYDGTTEGTGGTYETTGLFAPDTFTGAALNFTDKNAGSGKTLNVSGGIINDGNSGNNYTITYVSNSGSTIAPKAITVSFSDADKTYDGTLEAAIGAETFSGVVAGDAVSLDRSGMGATYAAKKAGTQSVNYTGIALTGTDAGNYTINSTAVGSGIINRKAVTFVVDEKITKDYDGTTTVHGTGTATGFVSGDDAAVNALGNTADSSAGENKPVNYVFSLLGMDADNYFLTSTTGGGTVTISTGKMEEVSTLAAAIVPKETMVGIPEIKTMAPQSNTGSGDTVSKDSDNKEEKKQTEEQTDNQVNTQGNEPIRHEFGNDGKLSFTNKGVNPPASMSAEAVARQQSQETAGREEDNQSMDSNNNEGD